jgi:hypothetical protein
VQIAKIIQPVLIFTEIMPALYLIYLCVVYLLISPCVCKETLNNKTKSDEGNVFLKEMFYWEEMFYCQSTK